MRHSEQVFVYDMSILYESERIQDRLKYCYLTGNYEQPHSMQDVHAMISTEWPNECNELMEQAHTANFAAVTDTKDKLTELKDSQSHGDSISKTQCTALRQKFTSLVQAELDETASFSIHKDHLVCEILPLLIKTSSTTYKANEHYVQLMKQDTSTVNSSSKARTGGNSSSNHQPRKVISAHKIARTSAAITDHSVGAAVSGRKRKLDRLV
jgi:hypothetical protein